MLHECCSKCSIVTCMLPTWGVFRGHGGEGLRASISRAQGPTPLGWLPCVHACSGLS